MIRGALIQLKRIPHDTLKHLQSLVASREDFTRTKTEVETLKERLSEYQIESEELRSRNEALERQVDITKTQTNKLQSSNCELLEKLARFEEENKNLQQKLRESSEKLEELVKELNGYRLQLQEQDEQILARENVIYDKERNVQETETMIRQKVEQFQTIHQLLKTLKECVNTSIINSILPKATVESDSSTAAVEGRGDSNFSAVPLKSGEKHVLTNKSDISGHQIQTHERKRSVGKESGCQNKPAQLQTLVDAIHQLNSQMESFDETDVKQKESAPVSMPPSDVSTPTTTPGEYLNMSSGIICLKTMVSKFDGCDARSFINGGYTDVKGLVVVVEDIVRKLQADNSELKSACDVMKEDCQNLEKQLKQKRKKLKENKKKFSDLAVRACSATTNLSTSSSEPSEENITLSSASHQTSLHADTPPRTVLRSQKQATLTTTVKIMLGKTAKSTSAFDLIASERRYNHNATPRCLSAATACSEIVAPQAFPVRVGSSSTSQQPQPWMKRTYSSRFPSVPHK